MCTWVHKHNMYKVQIVIANLPECCISFKKYLFTLNNKIVLRVNNSTILLSYLFLILKFEDYCTSVIINLLV